MPIFQFLKIKLEGPLTVNCPESNSEDFDSLLETPVIRDSLSQVVHACDLEFPSSDDFDSNAGAEAGMNLSYSTENFGDYQDSDIDSRVEALHAQGLFICLLKARKLSVFFCYFV